MVGALGLGLALGVSGLLEAFVTPSTLPDAVNLLVGVAVWLAFLTYVLVLGGRAARLGLSADLSEEDTEAATPVA